MDEEATQPATQLVIDPRRLGHHNSGLNDEDLTDIFCILHPASMPACQAAAQIAESSPEHTISTTGVELRVRGDYKHLNIPNTFDLAAQGVVSRDIALRLSADLKEPLVGFCFGRNPQRCDFILGNTEGLKRISNVHFRIYINQHGVIMLEDQSTNGTYVENVLLRAKDKESGRQYKHTLQQGSLITLLMTPPDEDIKFVVRIPQREGDYEATYEQNLRRYFDRLTMIKQARRAERAEAVAAIVAATAGEEKPKGAHQGPPDIFAPVPRKVPSTDKLDVGRHIKEWRGGLRYNKIGIVGKGAFATVYKISAKYDGTCYAAKELEKRRFMKNGILDQKVDMEMQIMSKINHPHIVQYIEHIDWDDYLYIIMDYVPHGDLGGLIAKRKVLEEHTVKVMAIQLLGALKYLHTMGVTHRDIKPDNILIESHNPFHVKLTDFGLSKMVGNEETFLRTFCGTLLYCAPEVYTEYRDYDSQGNRKPRVKDKKPVPRQRYDQAVDLWSLGAVLFYALCGSPPYPALTGTTHYELLNSIMTKPLDVRPLQRVNVSEAGIRFVKSMLQVNPERRPSIEDLDSSHWFVDGSTGISFDDDDDDGDDEVDMIGETDSEVIEEGASQLNIRGAHTHNKDESKKGNHILAQPIPNQSEIDIPSSFRTGDSGSSESFAFMGNPKGNARLFGEVNASALGSSGVIPVEHLNLPLSASISGNGNGDSRSNFDIDSAAMETEADPSAPSFGIDDNDPSQVNGGGSVITANTRLVISDRAVSLVAAPSLFGAESMVEQLQMDSSSVQIPATGFSTPDNRDLVTSLRRPRDDKTVIEDSQPASKRIRSNREIEIPISKTVFWDERDKSTWHDDYPDMMLSQYTEALEVAKAHGEKFVHGEKIFGMYIGSYRKTPSAEPEPHVRAQSEPTIDQGRIEMMKRDERRVEVFSNSQQPPTGQEDSPMTTSHESAQSKDRLNHSDFAQLLNQDIIFKPPRRILARLIATSDSVIQNITLTVTEPFTSWGRGPWNTAVFPEPREDRIPKSAFKLLLWREGLSEIHNENSQHNMSFWISTKATLGIKVNGIQLNSYDSKTPATPSKEWGELRHGDEVTVWTKELKSAPYVKLRFECYFGASQAKRLQDTAPFTALQESSVSEEIDQYCSRMEHYLKEVTAENLNTAEQEKRIEHQVNHAQISLPIPFATG